MNSETQHVVKRRAVAERAHGRSDRISLLNDEIANTTTSIASVKTESSQEDEDSAALLNANEVLWMDSSLLTVATAAAAATAADESSTTLVSATKRSHAEISGASVTSSSSTTTLAALARASAPSRVSLPRLMMPSASASTTAATTTTNAHSLLPPISAMSDAELLMCAVSAYAADSRGSTTTTVSGVAVSDVAPIADGAADFEAPLAKEPMFRNFFSKLVFVVPPPPPSEPGDNFDDVRVYVDGSIGYGGNATRRREQPPSGERALIFNCEVRNPITNRIVDQCAKCSEYFSSLGYFKQNPDQAHKNLLVKNNEAILVRNSMFPISLKLMCCCAHHNVGYFNFFVEVINEQGLASFRTVFGAVVKQWKKGATKVDPSHVLLHAVT